VDELAVAAWLGRVDRRASSSPAAAIGALLPVWEKVVSARCFDIRAGAQHVLRVNPKSPSPMGVAPPVQQRLSSEGTPEDEDFEEPTQSRPAVPKFYSEPPTRQKNVVASVYQSLLSVFDEMSPAQRMEFVDLASRFASLDDEARAGLMELLPQYAKLSAGDRAAVRALLARMTSEQSR
jgi:hypothetical protein